MTRIPFNVSARAAILIGRENIANSKGAIIELVKNCYDADSLFCLIYVDNKFSVLREQLTDQQKNRMILDGINPLYFEKLYRYSGDKHLLKPDVPTRYLNAFKKRIKELTALYIVDVGDGMHQEIIRNHWMTIGTDNKLFDFQTHGKRVKSGAKGIGRFALDKLGSKCTMTTLPNPEKYVKLSGDVPLDGSVWSVNWRDFEGRSKTINDVTANLESLQNTDLINSTFDSQRDFDLSSLWAQLGKIEYRNKDVLPENNLFGNFTHGTVLRITDLNDDWNSELVRSVFEDLEILVPPKDIEDFRIFLLSSLEPGEYGEILGPECEEFDYKIEAKANNQQEVELTIYREEFDIEKIPKDFFDRESVKKNIPTFPLKKWTKSYRFSELLEGFDNRDGNLSKIGAFDFNFYFLKRSSTAKDTKRFFYKEIADTQRKAWLNQFAGIKIYRDNFRVRPYGEIREAAFDWLGLGLRQSSSPAGFGKENGGYKVRPENIAGAIKISRLTNLEFEDKSSRDGLQDTKTFQVFRRLIISIIAKFEEDRASIGREFSAYGKESSRAAGPIDEDTENLVRQILERERQKRQNSQNQPLLISDTSISTKIESSSDKETETESELSILARYAEEKAEENEKLLEEQKLLRGMASSGIVAASFGHDLSKTKDSLNTRFDELTELFEPKISPLDFNDVDDFDNPFEFIKEMKKDDRNISMWLGFSLGFARKDKRKRKQLFLDQFFRDMRSNWYETLAERGISLVIDCPDDLKMRVFEIDFDSIFLNLLVNSMEAFKSLKAQVERKIFIKCVDEENQLIIEYRDTGPGLPHHLSDPEIIFKPMYTTKRDSVGQEVGTGLGMWIVKVISDEYQANAKLLVSASEESGFGIVFNFPKKYKSKD